MPCSQRVGRPQSNRRMNLEEKIAKVRALIAQRDEIDHQIAECLGDAALSVRPPKVARMAAGVADGRATSLKLIKSHVAVGSIRPLGRRSRRCSSMAQAYP